MIHADVNITILSSKCDINLGRGRINAGIPAKFDTLIFLQFEIMPTGVKVAAPPQVHPSAWMWVNRCDIAQPFAQKRRIGKSAVRQFERRMDRSFSCHSSHRELLLKV